MGDHEAHGGEGLSPEPAMDKSEAPDLEAGRLLFARPCRFVKGVVAVSGLPPELGTEVAFAGRSNVGKSSLINALVGQKGLARASNTPGRTQEINFFDLDGILALVDLPGYGFASAPKDKVEAWTRLIKSYLKGRSVLRRAVLLIDARHGIKDTDREIMKMLDTAAVVYQGVLTKADKVSASHLAAVTEAVMAELKKRPASHPVLHVTSSETGQGMPELRAELAQLAEFDKGAMS
ncbi:MAG: YihA family ribosome biogenesis GTP-binding protein [Alphaproteobacteria bacterium]|nr:YihA family ribosome biogenesis GTP-binding protein [Alphaproteobacteria bacterium]